MRASQYLYLRQGEQKIEMSRTRFRVVLLLLVLVLVIASILFALLTYWLGQEVLPAASSQHFAVVVLAALSGV